jgi:hypothetical protein
MLPCEGKPLPVAGTFANLALRLADLGYSPIPLHGKRPFQNGWQHRRDPDLEWIAGQVSECSAHNLGIVCGRLVAVDVDVLDPDLAYEVDALAVARLGDAPLRIGRWPKRLRVYRISEPVGYMAAGCEGARVEILGEGRQFAAYGIHPDTGQPYVWPDGDLTEQALEDLSLVTPDALRHFVAEVEAMLPRREDAPARARMRAGGAPPGGGAVVRGADGRVVDGRDHHLSRLAFHTVHDAIKRGEDLQEDRLLEAVWHRFCDSTELGNAKGSGRPWSKRDALRKVRDKLSLHRAGRLPGRQRGTETIAPFHPLPTGGAEDARAEVRCQIRGFLARAQAWHAAAKEKRGEPEHAGLAVEVAAGKTSITCAELATDAAAETTGFVAETKAQGLPHRVLFLVPTHKLGGEVQARLARLGLRVATWRGREAEDPETGEAMCANLAAVQDALAALQDVDSAACSNRDGARCRFFDACAYQRQKAQTAKADVVVAAHEMMLGTLPTGLGRGFGLVIVDEGWLQDGVETGRALIVETLRAGESEHFVPRWDDPTRRDDEATNDLHALRRRLAGAVEAESGLYLTCVKLEAAGLTAADCTLAHGLEWRRKVEDVMYPGMPEEARREAVRRCAGNAVILRLAALWKAAGELLEGEGEATGRVELATRDGAEGRQRVVLLHTMRRIAEKVLALPMLLLDATLPATLLRHRLPRLRVLAEVRAAAPHMRVHQILGGFGKTSVVPYPEIAEAENRRRLARIAEVRDFIALLTGGARALVVTHENLEAHFGGLPGVELAHFNAVAGRDEWGPGPGREGVRHLFVVGRPLPAPEDVRQLTAALTGRPVPAEQPQRVTRGATMRDGTGAAVQVRAYADPDLEAVRAAITDAELVQVIGRGRGINRTAANPLDVWLLAGDVVVPLPLDRLCRWEDVAPGPLERMAARSVVLASPSDAAKAYPDLFPKGEKAAREALARAAEGAGVKRGDFGPKTLWELPIGKWVRNTAWVRVDYRPAGRGQQTRTAWARSDCLPELRTWLEAVIGTELAHYAPAEPLAAAQPVRTPGGSHVRPAPALLRPPIGLTRSAPHPPDPARWERAQPDDVAACAERTNHPAEPHGTGGTGALGGAAFRSASAAPDDEPRWKRGKPAAGLAEEAAGNQGIPPLPAASDLQHPPAWSGAATVPREGACCFRCAGSLWWREAEAPTGWCCSTCHPAPPGMAVVEVRTRDGARGRAVGAVVLGGLPFL